METPYSSKQSVYTKVGILLLISIAVIAGIFLYKTVLEDINIVPLAQAQVSCSIGGSVGTCVSNLPAFRDPGCVWDNTPGVNKNVCTTGNWVDPQDQYTYSGGTCVSTLSQRTCEDQVPGVTSYCTFTTVATPNCFCDTSGTPPPPPPPPPPCTTQNGDCSAGQECCVPLTCQAVGFGTGWGCGIGRAAGRERV